MTTLAAVAMVWLAAGAADDEAVSRGRILDGHIFMPTDAAPMPFAVTNFSSSMLLGYGSSNSDLVIGGIDLSKKLQYAGMGGVLRYELAFLDHFSVRAGVNTLIYSGITGRSALAIGTSVQFGVEAGATATLLATKQLRLSLLFDFSYAPNLALTLGNAVKSVFNSCSSPDGCSVDVADVFSVVSLATYAPALSAAWSPWRPFGLTAFTGFSVGTAKTFSTGGAFAVGGSADLDFMEWRVPIGLQLRASSVLPVVGDALQKSIDLGGGIFYTGKKELSVGVQFTARWFQVRREIQPDWGVLANIGLRYYW